MKRLYHYTCAHSINGIRRDGKLNVNAQPLLGGMELVWFTDLEQPDVYALGLTSHLLKCRRTEYRAAVDTEAMHWPASARTLRGTARFQSGIRALESATLAQPMHWWVSLWPVPVAELEPVA